MVNRYTKMVHFLLYTKEITSEVTAGIVMHEVFWHRGLPNSIISYHDSQFIAKIGRFLLCLLHIDGVLSLSYHLETDNY